MIIIRACIPSIWSGSNVLPNSSGYQSLLTAGALTLTNKKL